MMFTYQCSRPGCCRYSSIAYDTHTFYTWVKMRPLRIWYKKCILVLKNLYYVQLYFSERQDFNSEFKSTSSIWKHREEDFLARPPLKFAVTVPTFIDLINIFGRVLPEGWEFPAGVFVRVKYMSTTRFCSCVRRASQNAGYESAWP